MGSADPLLEKWMKNKKSENTQKRAVFVYILRAIRVGRCGERRYADHVFIQMYFRMHHFVVKFSKFSSPQAARGGVDPPNQNPADIPVYSSLLMTLMIRYDTRCCSNVRSQADHAVN